MYQVSDAYLKQTKEKVQTFCLTGTVNKIAFTNHDILSGSFTITNQCSEQNDVKIGSVYIGELRCTFKPELQVPDWTNAEIVVLEGLLIGDKWEDVPLGIYTVSEANDTEYGIDIVAYDNMKKFTQKCKLSTTQGTPRELILLACDACDVQLGMTEEEFAALPNGTEELSLYTENDIETWQDLIYWVAQAVGCIATIDRYGKLVLRQYTQNIVDTLSNHARFTGSKFSKYETRYSGVSVVNIKSQTTSYYGADKDDEYLTYNLGANPFLQYGVDEVKKKQRKNILNALLDICYVPFETQVLCGSLYDLCDIVRCTDGIAQGKLGCIMYYEYTYNGGCKIAGYGSNTELANARSKTDKNIEGLSSNVKSGDIKFFTFINAANYRITDGDIMNVIDIKFTSGVATVVMFNAEILLNSKSKAEAEATICKAMYSLNGIDILEFIPTETYKNGKHILNLMYIINIQENSINRWVVALNAIGGMIDIERGCIRASLYGQGLVGDIEWDGYITIEDTLNTIGLKYITTSDKVNTIMTPLLLDIERNIARDTIMAVQLDTVTNITKLYNDVVDFMFNIETWTFTTNTPATYSERYVNVTDGVYKLNTSYTYVSADISIDVGKACMLEIEYTEFVTVENIDISVDTDDVRYLFKSNDIYYTIVDERLVEVSIDELSADVFIMHGCTSVEGTLLIELESPQIYKYTAKNTISPILATVTAVPYQQVIQTECNMNDISIHGILSSEAKFEGDIYIRLSYDGGARFTDDILLLDALDNELIEAYELLDERKSLIIAFILKTKIDEIAKFKYYFNNNEEVTINEQQAE